MAKKATPQGGNKDLLSRSREMQERETYIKRILTGVALVLSVVLCVALMHRPELRLRRFFIEGTREISKEAVESHVLEALSGYYAFLIPRDSVFFAPVSSVKESLLAAFPRLRDVEISTTWGGAYSVRLREYEPAYTSCIGSKCYFVAADGFRYTRAPEFVESSMVTLLGGTTTERAFVIPEHDFANMTRVLEALEFPVEGDYVRSVEITADRDFFVQTFLGYELRFDLDISHIELRERLRALYETEHFAQKLARAPDTLIYIDMRFGNKVFFKFEEADEESLE